MKSLSYVQNLILISIVNSCLTSSQKHDCLCYLFWHLCWDFDVDLFLQNIQFPASPLGTGGVNPCPRKVDGDRKEIKNA